MSRPIIFDIDGTLTATNDVDTDCFVQALAEHLGTTIDSDWSQYRHVTDSGIAAEILERQQRPVAEVAIVRERFVRLISAALRKTPHCCVEIAGAASFVKGLRALPNVVLGLATGGWGETALAKLRQAGIDATGLAFASADDSQARIEIMLKCRGQILATAPAFTDQPVYVGDGVWDVASARTLGWQFIGIGSGERAEQLRQRGAELVFPDYRDAQAILAAMGVAKA
jgi:phosphoglycolate phosphatase-like HAD superfamily hydrolase